MTGTGIAETVAFKCDTNSSRPTLLTGVVSGFFSLWNCLTWRFKLAFFLEKDLKLVKFKK